MNFHRSCTNPECFYDMCLTCCNELREHFQPGGHEGETSQHQFLERSNDQDTKKKEKAGLKSAGTGGIACGMKLKTDLFKDFPDWSVADNDNIPCPLKERGGCGNSVLELRRIFKPSFVQGLIKSAERVVGGFTLPSVDAMQKCSFCAVLGHVNETDSLLSGLKKAASRKDSYDNFLFILSAANSNDTTIEHFQAHWMKGEPVIVRDVLDKTNGLSWEPMVMWRAFREKGASSKSKEETQSVFAIDCLDWCQVNSDLIVSTMLLGSSKYL